MPKYLITASYTAEGVRGLLKDGGTKRRQAAEAALKSVGGRVEAPLGLRDFGPYAVQRAGGNRSNPRPLAHADRESQLPGTFAEFEREQQTGRRRGRLSGTGHGLHRYAPLLCGNSREA
jgi:hypothetical protein